MTPWNVEVVGWDGALELGQVHFTFQVWPHPRHPPEWLGQVVAAEQGRVRFDIHIDNQLVQQVFVAPNMTTTWDAEVVCKKSIIVLGVADEGGQATVSASIAMPPNAVPRTKRISVWERLAAYRLERGK